MAFTVGLIVISAIVILPPIAAYFVRSSKEKSKATEASKSETSE